MKLLIAASLMTIALVPLASANHDVCAAAYTCVATYGNSVGDCDTTSGYEYSYNYAGAYSYQPSTPAGPVYAFTGAGAGCWDYSFFGYNGDGSFIGAGAGGAAAQNFVYAGASWYSYSYSNPYGSYSACNTNVYTYSTVTGYQVHSLGCPAGGPPEITGVALP